MTDTADATPEPLSRRIARHAVTTRSTDLPPGAVTATKHLLLDAFAVGIAGGATPESRAIETVATGWGSGDDARVWHSGQRLPAATAALVNAHHVHCLEFDAIHEPAVVHPMTVVLPVLLAAIEREARPIDGARLLAAIAVGVDVAAGLGVVTTTALRFFRPGTAGVFGAVTAVASALGLDEDVTVAALGLAYGQVCGTMQPHTEGNAMLGLQVGFNARNALAAVDLARGGQTGPTGIFEGRFGYFGLIEEAGEPDELAAALGARWEVARTSLKPYPCGRAAHSGIDGTLQLMAEHGFTAAEVAAVEVRVPPMVAHLVGRPLIVGAPSNYLRLCLPFQVASALVHGRVDLATVSDTIDPRIAELSTRVTVRADDNPDPNAFDPQTVTITLADGRRVARTLPHVLGAPANPMTDDERLRKVVGCLEHAGVARPEDAARRLAGTIEHLEACSDVRELFGAVS